MANRDQRQIYMFSVEGQTEKWYLERLQELVNSVPEKRYRVEIQAKANVRPKEFVKLTIPITVHSLAHICDYEGDNKEDVSRFENVLKELKDASKKRGIPYELGYSNLCFELWIILHKMDCNHGFYEKRNYLEYINDAFGKKYQSLGDYKRQQNFKACLDEISLEDVRNAIRRASQIMSDKRRDGARIKTCAGFNYYPDNPALTIWEQVKKILDECVPER